MNRWPKESLVARAVGGAVNWSTQESRAARALTHFLQRFTQLVLVGLLISCSQLESQAGFVFAFNTTGTNQVFDVNTNSIIDVPVYLVQTDGENRLSSIGLFSAGASVTYSSGTPGPSTVNSATLATSWTDTNANLTSVQPGQVIMEGLIEDVNFPVFAISNAVLLGTVQFQAGLEGNVTNLELSLNGVTPFANNLVDITEVTPIGFRQATITVVATPEPASLCLFGGVCLIGIGWRSRKHAFKPQGASPG